MNKLSSTLHASSEFSWSKVQLMYAFCCKSFPPLPLLADDHSLIIRHEVLQSKAYVEYLSGCEVKTRISPLCARLNKKLFSLIHILPSRQSEIILKTNEARYQNISLSKESIINQMKITNHFPPPSSHCLSALLQE